VPSCLPRNARKPRTIEPHPIYLAFERSPFRRREINHTALLIDAIHRLHVPLAVCELRRLAAVGLA
jgi:hypothetical protein